METPFPPLPLALPRASARWRRWLLALGLAAPASALALTLTVDGGWNTFDWTGGLGGIDSPADGYTVTSATAIEIQVVDCCVIGDRFEIFVNDVSYTLPSTTAPANAGLPSGAFNGPTAWTDTRPSKVSFVLPAGTYDIDISVYALAPNLLQGGSLSSGEGFIQALTSVPEPGALLLLALGLGGLFWMSTPRRGYVSARPSRPKR